MLSYERRRLERVLPGAIEYVPLSSECCPLLGKQNPYDLIQHFKKHVLFVPLVRAFGRFCFITSRRKDMPESIGEKATTNLLFT